MERGEPRRGAKGRNPLKNCQFMAVAQSMAAIHHGIAVVVLDMPNLIHEGVLILVPPHLINRKNLPVPPFCHDVTLYHVHLNPTPFQKYDQSLPSEVTRRPRRNSHQRCGVREGWWGRAWLGLSWLCSALLCFAFLLT